MELFSGDAEGVLRGLDEAQREVAANPLGPMCVLAGAGTGKTRAITHRIAYGVLSGAVVPQRLLAVTFTARAAGELRQRLRGLGVSGVQTRTFHAAALRQLHYFWPRAVGGALPDVLPHKASLVAEVARRLKLPSDRAVVRDLAAEIEWSKVGMLTADTYVSVAERVGRVAPGVDRVMMARVIEEYEQVKAARRVVDFEDVLLLMVGLLLEYPQVVREVREQYRHFVVDEYQDVNVVQQRLLDLWVGDRSDVCVVGDPAQTIYSFTGASAEHLLGFGRRFEGARVVRLERNYRSSPQVVNLANAMLEGQR
ncbi:ATP-dependent helicase, partial [Dermatophilus congolensis]